MCASSNNDAQVYRDCLNILLARENGDKATSDRLFSKYLLPQYQMDGIAGLTAVALYFARRCAALEKITLEDAVRRAWSVHPLNVKDSA